MSQEAPISKTQRKQAVHLLQALGEVLVELNDDQLAAVELPERLRDAVMAARRITKFEAKRRQLQYIGKLMRSVEVEPIRAALDAVLARSRRQTAAHKRIEAWRERLLAGPGAVAELLVEYPRADARRLRALIRDALREREAGRPPRSFRELYQALRKILEERES
ncbi:MAG: ribosome biogenesis factor YjgA [Burkholderiales bacterium]